MLTSVLKTNTFLFVFRNRNREEEHLVRKRKVKNIFIVKVKDLEEEIHFLTSRGGGVGSVAVLLVM